MAEEVIRGQFIKFMKEFFFGGGHTVIGDVAVVNVVASKLLLCFDRCDPVNVLRFTGRNLSINRFIGGSGGGSVAEVPLELMGGLETGKGAFGGGGNAVALRSADSRFTILSRGVSEDIGDSTFGLVMASDHEPSSRSTQLIR